MTETLNPQRIHAAATLVRLSALGEHHMIAQHVDIEGHRINWDAINDFGWSSGEIILIELLKVILHGAGNVEIEDLWRLDDENREVATLALRQAMTSVPASEHLL